MIALYVLALVLEVAGLALAADGFRRTWREFRRPDDAFWTPVLSPVQRATRMAYFRVRRLIGFPVPPKVVSVSGVASASATAFSVDFRDTWAVWPPMSDTEAFEKMLHARLGELNDRIQQVDRRLRANADADTARHADLATAIDSARAEAQGHVQTITVGGLREQVFGLVLIVGGTVLGGIGNILSAL